MTDHTPQLILASGSPRRRDFMDALGFAYVVVSPNVDEDAIPYKSPREYVMKAAFAKASAVAETQADGAVIIAADTIVTRGDTIYGKPIDARDAVRILRELSGKVHKVMTAVAVAEVGGSTQLHVEESTVRFHELTLAQIEAYVATGEPLDKAGAYAIQGLGSDLVAEVRGDYTNIVGLPLNALLNMLAQTSVDVAEARLRLRNISGQWGL